MTELAQGLPDAGERAYVYARACGIIGKSFVGSRIPALGTLRSPGELDRLLFPEEHHELLGRELLVDLEKHIEKRAVDQILTIINSYTDPPELFIRQIRLYEYSDLKACIHHIAGGIDTLPSLCDIGRYGTINFEAFPDIAAMLKGTEFDFILSRDLKALQPDSEDFTPIETELDARYYLGLAESLEQLPYDDRAVVQRILADEISLRNCVWALRLRTYFKKSAADTGEHLMDIRMHSDMAGDLTAAAWDSLHLPLDTRAQWQGWKWEKFLNPDKSGESWSLNPRHFQNAASQYLYRLAKNRFHSAPGELSTTFCFIKLKQFEEDLLTSIAEGLAMGMNSADVFELLEVAL
ncbi:MAG: V-type ATPase subunit [Treponema sp.]|nr:V-type ATPase subunit [Treponema sp.]